MDEIRDALTSFVDEGFKLRFDYEHPHNDSGPRELVTSLKEVRQRLDRLEEILVRSMRIKAKAQRNVTAVQAELSEKWDSHLVSIRAKSKSTWGDDFVSPKEKYADANLATLEVKRKELKSKEVLSYAEEAVEVLKSLHRGLGDIRQELLTRIRTVQWETSLEH